MREPRLGEFKKKAASIGALLLLCLLWASTSLRSDLLPASSSSANSSPFSRQAILFALFAAVAAVAAFVRKAQWPRGPALALSVLAGIGLFVVPAVIIQVARGYIDDSTRVALFSLVPIFAVVLQPHLGPASSSEQRGGLAAGLVAVVGTLLVFPLEPPQTTASALAFGGIMAAAAAVAAANCVAVRIVCESTASSTSTIAAIASASAAVTLGACSVLVERHSPTAGLVDPWAALDFLALALLFWLMRRMSAVRMTTRFLIAPLTANLIGLAFLRPGVQWRGRAGLALITLGSGWLLLAPEDKPDGIRSLLGIN
jgi:drug/metabolite transporter (DMT)-like permease